MVVLCWNEVPNISDISIKSAFVHGAKWNFQQCKGAANRDVSQRDMGHLYSIRVHMTVISPKRHALTFSITCSLQRKLPGECNHAAGRANPLMTQSLNWLQSDPNQSLPVRPFLCKLINRGTASGKVWPRSEQWVPWETIITRHFVTNYRFFHLHFISRKGREQECGNTEKILSHKSLLLSFSFFSFHICQSWDATRMMQDCAMLFFFELINLIFQL